MASRQRNREAARRLSRHLPQLVSVNERLEQLAIRRSRSAARWRLLAIAQWVFLAALAFSAWMGR